MQQYDLKMGKYCNIELMCVSGCKVSMVFFWSLAHCGGRSRNTSKISKQHKELFFKKKYIHTKIKNLLMNLKDY